MRWDSLDRNLLELAHRGFAVGVDAWQGWREDWAKWGIDRQESANDWPRVLQGYGVIAGGIPGLGERHRVIGSVYASVVRTSTASSAPHIGGGPSDDEFPAIGRPIVPGGGLDEFWPDHYAVGIAEYRYELFFFTFLSARASLARLDPRPVRGQPVRPGPDPSPDRHADLARRPPHDRLPLLDPAPVRLQLKLRRDPQRSEWRERVPGQRVALVLSARGLFACFLLARLPLEASVFRPSRSSPPCMRRACTPARPTAHPHEPRRQSDRRRGPAPGAGTSARSGLSAGGG